MHLHFKPESKFVRAGNMIVGKNVVGMSDPEAGGPSVCVQQTHRFFYINGKIVIVVVVGLNRILNKECVTHSVVRDIVFNSEIMNSVSCDSSIVSIMYCVSNHIGFVNITNHVEVNRVTTQLKCLTDIL